MRSPGRRSAWAGARGGLTRTVTHTGTVGIIVPCGLAYVHGALRDSDPSRGNLMPSVMVPVLLGTGEIFLQKISGAPSQFFWARELFGAPLSNHSESLSNLLSG